MYGKTTGFVALGLSMLALQSLALAEPRTPDNPSGCRVVERKGTSDNSGSISSSVTAGNGHVSGYTSGGNGVTVSSGNGSSVAAATTSGPNGSTIVTSSDGNCIMYVNPGRKGSQK
ncbi:MAG TPA: hypothetical protein VM782_14575 [Stellaceae bacterium]|nr:hypothetical protein [Stellaceae bacterium]